MTTIAYKDGVMVADTMMSRGNECVHGAVKIFRTSKFLVGMSGDMSNLLAFKGFISRYEKDLVNAGGLWSIWQDAPDYGEGFCALIIDGDGTIWNTIDGPPVMVPSSFDAIGSGAAYAMGAMGMGATAAQAVEVAHRFDRNTGGAFIEVALHG